MTTKAPTIRIEGHICCTNPTDTMNAYSNLSFLRAQAVYNYLVSKGIEKNRLKYIGLGPRTQKSIQ